MQYRNYYGTKSYEVLILWIYNAAYNLPVLNWCYLLCYFS